jgi:hypothetical protein
MLSTVIQVPANSSRLFKTEDEAIGQPKGFIQLETVANEGYLTNILFSPDLIRYDSNYCTSNPFQDLQAKSYMFDLKNVFQNFSRVIEIGCGQGEFVSYLRHIGFKPTDLTQY